MCRFHPCISALFSKEPNRSAGRARGTRPRALALGVLLGILFFSPATNAQDSKPATPDFGPLTNLLLNRSPADACAELKRQHEGRKPTDDERFVLALARLLRAVERFGQSLQQYGFEPTRDLDILTFVGLPVVRIPLPENERPEEIAYEDLRRMFQQLIDDLAEVDKTLSLISTDVALKLPIGLIRLDFNRDGQLSEDERLWKLFARLTNIRNISREQAEAFVIHLDRADVEWLRGYTYLLRGVLECVLAYDFHELFERTGHLAFTKIKSPYPFLARRSRKGDSPHYNDPFYGFADLVAVIHLLNFKLREPERMRDAHQDFLWMIHHSRSMWQFVLNETDNNAEWIPSPRQTGVIPGLGFTESQVDGWKRALDEMEDLLKGKKLVPFWRNDARGVNLRKVFLEPRNIDLVMWIQGTDAAPFLEEGEKTSPATWSQFNQLFQGRFFAYAAWVN